jgi:hypothetical protein
MSKGFAAFGGQGPGFQHHFHLAVELDAPDQELEALALDLDNPFVDQVVDKPQVDAPHFLSNQVREQAQGFILQIQGEEGSRGVDEADLDLFNPEGLALLVGQGFFQTLDGVQLFQYFVLEGLALQIGAVQLSAHRYHCEHRPQEHSQDEQGQTLHFTGPRARMLMRR